MKEWLILAFIFFIGSLAGWLLELIFRRFFVGLAVFVIFYWAIDIIMNNILIYLGKYEIEEIE